MISYKRLKRLIRTSKLRVAASDRLRGVACRQKGGNASTMLKVTHPAFPSHTEPVTIEYHAACTIQ